MISAPADSTAAVVAPDSTVISTPASSAPTGAPSDSAAVVAAAAETTGVGAPRESPGRFRIQGAPPARLSRDASELARTTSQATRENVAQLLSLTSLPAGAPHRTEPVYLGVPGREAVELRLDGLPVTPCRWGETALLPVPLLAIEGARAYRAAPLLAPLSSTGGETVDLDLARASFDSTRSAVRLTRGSYGTFTEEVVLRRAVGSFLFSGFYGDSKSDGRILWGSQRGQTRGARLVHRLASGWASWDVGDAYDRSRLLATKRALWDRTATTLRWWRSDSSGIAIDAALSGSLVRGRWETLEGITERRGRHLFAHAAIETGPPRSGWTLVLEAEGSRVHLRRPGRAQTLLQDVSAGLVVGHRRVGESWEGRVALGLARMAPTVASPIGSIDVASSPARALRLLVHASRSVRNRSLPRLPADGGAWVRQGVDLAAERVDESPEALWRLSASLETGRRSSRAQLAGGCDLLHATRALGAEESWLPYLATDAQADLPDSAQRRDASYLQPWISLRARLGAGFALEGSSAGTISSEPVTSQLALPEVSGAGALSWSGSFFRGDLDLTLALRASARTEVATPYGSLPGLIWSDGEAGVGVGKARLFWVLSNLTNVDEPSFAWDGGFQPLPRRHYRAGLTWSFLD